MTHFINMYTYKNIVKIEQDPKLYQVKAWQLYN